MNSSPSAKNMAKHVVEELSSRKEKLILAESCTAGFVCATLGQVPGVSEVLCGSLVTYRPSVKRRWLKVRQDTIEAHTTESAEVATEMATGALEQCEEATWSAAIVGHFGPNAPEALDGVIYVAVARRTRKGNFKCKVEEHQLKDEDRIQRQHAAAELVLIQLSRTILKKAQKEESASRKKRAKAGAA